MLKSALLLSFSIAAIHSQEFEIEKKLIDQRLKDALKPVISRDDNLTIGLRELQLTVSKTGSYMITITIKLKGIDPDKNKDFAEEYTSILSECKTIEAGKKLSFGSKKVGKYLPLRNVDELEMIIRLTKLDDKQKNIFDKVAKTSLDYFEKDNPVALTLTNLLEIDDNALKANKEIIEFSNSFTIPSNFVEYHYIKKAGIQDPDLKTYPTANGIPLLTNNIPISILLASSEISNSSSVVGIGKDVLNSLGHLLFGKKLVKSDEVNNIAAYVTFNFSKDENSSLEVDFLEPITLIQDELSRGSADLTDVAKKITTLENAVSLKKSARFTSRTKANIVFFIDIARAYLHYKAITNTSYNPEKKRDKKREEAVNGFIDFLESANNAQAEAQLKYFGSAGYYQASSPTATRYAKFFLPYSLPNSTTLKVLAWQRTLHEFTSEEFDNDSDLGQLIRSKKKTISYEQ